ncbi:hypothetical protein QTP88_022761 [Uroleucon formosanum]
MGSTAIVVAIWQRALAAVHLNDPIVFLISRVSLPHSPLVYGMTSRPLPVSTSVKGGHTSKKKIRAMDHMTIIGVALPLIQINFFVPMHTMKQNPLTPTFAKLMIINYSVSKGRRIRFTIYSPRSSQKKPILKCKVRKALTCVKNLQWIIKETKKKKKAKNGITLPPLSRVVYFLKIRRTLSPFPTWMIPTPPPQKWSASIASFMTALVNANSGGRAATFV